MAGFMTLIVSPSLLFSVDYGINLDNRLASPSLVYWFGTDWLGRDLFTLTLSGLLHGLRLGVFAAIFSGMVAFVMALLASTNSHANWLIKLIIDILLSIPHLLLLIVLVLVFQSGPSGVIVAVVITHWPKLTRILCNEIDRIQKSQFVVLASQFGQPKLKVVFNHIIPYVMPHWLLGILLMVPHIIIHVAGLTFLGFGVDPTTPSIGLLLSEASRYIISGQWWLALFPGIALVLMLLLFSWSTQLIVKEIKKEGL